MKTKFYIFIIAFSFSICDAFVAPAMRKAKHPITPGSQNFTTAGTFTFTVPAYNTLTVQIWGGGGQASGVTVTNMGPPCCSYFFRHGTAGGASHFDSLHASGGFGGTSGAFGGTGGSSSGGDINTTGGNGFGRSSQTGGAGGSSPFGGTGGAGGVAGSSSGEIGQAPGGGGGGFGSSTLSPLFSSSGGGAGGYSKKVYTKGALGFEQKITVTVGAGGSGASQAGYAGAVGRVSITWN